MSRAQEFQPDWMSPPGETIRDLLVSRNLSPDWLAETLSLSKDYVDDLLAGRGTVGEEVAQGLAHTLGASKHFWIRLDQIYQEALNQARGLEDDWITQVPLDDMIKHGWITRPGKNERLSAVLDFFGITQTEDWKRVYEPIRQDYAFKTSLSFESNPIGVSAWLRQAELMAAAIECSSWRADTFREALETIRTKTKQKDPQIFIPAVQSICAQHGVAFVVVPPVKGCRASGAARLISDDKAILVLSARYLSDDHFWFAFFHEAAHLVLHGGRRLMLDFGNSPADAADPQAEAEANDFASKLLIPGEAFKLLPDLSKTHKDVIRFANQIGVSPGIVVGQLQHHGYVKRSWLNRLKRHYKWDKSNLHLA